MISVRLSLTLHALYKHTQYTAILYMYIHCNHSQLFPHPAGGEAASRVGPKIVLDHVSAFIYTLYMFVCFGFSCHWLYTISWPNAKKSHTRHFTQCCKRGWVSPPPTPPPSPPAVSTRNWTKYNKSLKDPVRGAGSVQVQIRSYHNRQSGNLARKVRNAFPRLTALMT